MEKEKMTYQERREAYEKQLDKVTKRAEQGENVQDALGELREERSALNELRQQEEAREELNRMVHEEDAAPKEKQEERAWVDAQDVKRPIAPVGETRRIETEKPQEKREQEAFVKFIQTRGASIEGLKEVDNGVIIPQAVSYIPQDEVNTRYDVKQYFETVNVSTASGSYPILESANYVLSTVKELEENPELAKPKFHEVKWNIETRRGQLAISQEMIDDAVIDVTARIARHIQNRFIDTTNAAIMKLAKQFDAVDVKGKDDVVDALKNVINVTLDPAYRPMILCTASFYQELDTLKDKQGQYIFHQNITTGSGASLLGLQVVKVPDVMLGDKQGDKVAFIADPRAITLFDRNQMSAEWVVYPNYGRRLMGAIRFDVQITDKNAGRLLRIGGSKPNPS